MKRILLIGVLAIVLFGCSNSPYFPVHDFYNANPTRTLLKLNKFKTCQQTAEHSCGAACAMMVLHWFGDTSVTEEQLDREMDIRYLDNRRTDGGYGCTTEALVKAFAVRGYKVRSSLDSAGKDGKSFATAEAFSAFLQDCLRNQTPVLLENVAWGGHWVVLIGYDTMGTETIVDDVLIFADPYDTSDHRRDGYVVKSFERFFYEWFDAGVLTPGILHQQFVSVSR